MIKKIIPIIYTNVRISNNKTILFYGYITLGDNFVIKNYNGLVEFKNNVSMRRFSSIRNIHGTVKVGSNTTINEFTVIQANRSFVHIGNGVRIAPFVKIIAENHIFKDKNIQIHKQGISSDGIKIGNNVWIGTGAIILNGVAIGDNVVIGAGSVVTKNFGNNKYIAWNPAIIIKEIFNAW